MIKRRIPRIKKNTPSAYVEIRIATDDLPPLSDDLYTYNQDAVKAIKVRITKTLDDTTKELRKEKMAIYKSIYKKVLK